MELRKQIVSIDRITVAVVAVVALVSVPAHHLAPGLSFFELAALVFCAFSSLVVIAACSLTFAQWILRCGGTDPQWFWFGAEPPGLQKLRQEEREKRRSES